MDKRHVARTLQASKYQKKLISMDSRGLYHFRLTGTDIPGENLTNRSTSFAIIEKASSSAKKENYIFHQFPIPITENTESDTAGSAASSSSSDFGTSFLFEPLVDFKYQPNYKSWIAKCEYAPSQKMYGYHREQIINWQDSSGKQHEGKLWYFYKEPRRSTKLEQTYQSDEPYVQDGNGWIEPTKLDVEIRGQLRRWPDQNTVMGKISAKDYCEEYSAEAEHIKELTVRDKEWLHIYREWGIAPINRDILKNYPDIKWTTDGVELPNDFLKQYCREEFELYDSRPQHHDNLKASPKYVNTAMMPNEKFLQQLIKDYQQINPDLSVDKTIKIETQNTAQSISSDIDILNGVQLQTKILNTKNNASIYFRQFIDGFAKLPTITNMIPMLYHCMACLLELEVDSMRKIDTVIVDKRTNVSITNPSPSPAAASSSSLAQKKRKHESETTSSQSSCNTLTIGYSSEQSSARSKRRAKCPV